VNCAPEIELDIGEQPWGQSQMGRAVAAFDWSTTPLGPSDSWPISLRTLVQAALNSAFPQAIVWGPDFTTIHNDAFLPILGKKPSAIGRSFADIWSEAWSSIGPIAADAYAGKSTFIENFPLVISRNGYDEQAYFTFCYSPLRDDTGNIAGMVDTVVETTGTIHALQTLEVLRRELVHRVKNSMAVTNAVVSASLRHATSLPEARDTISQRIGALGKVQDLLSLSEQGAWIREVVGVALAPHLDRNERAVVTGPDMMLSSQQAVGLSLAVYELATNAQKYGSLSRETGNIVVEWSLGPEDSFAFTWQESGGPEVRAPARSGFGSRLTNHIVAGYFSGKAETEFLPEGLRFRLVGSLKPRIT
jgi:two-component sensor histidine kinase